MRPGRRGTLGDLGAEQTRRLDEEEKGLRNIQTLGGQQQVHQRVQIRRKDR